MTELVERGEKADLLYFVGCMGSFDDRAKKTTVAFARIMKAAGVRFAILGREEKCNGDPARRAGNEYLYQMLAKDNIALLDKYKVTKIVTACPHCLSKSEVATWLTELSSTSSTRRTLPPSTTPNRVTTDRPLRQAVRDSAMRSAVRRLSSSTGKPM